MVAPMTAQGIFGQGRFASVCTFLIVALLALTAATGAEGAVTRTAGAKGPRRCGAGSTAVTKVVRKHGRTTVVRSCKPRAPESGPSSSPVLVPASPTTPASTPSPATTPGGASTDVGPTTPDTAPLPSPEEPGSESPPEMVTGSPFAVHVAIADGFDQNPLAPAEVTWHYSASATKTVALSNGGTKTEAAPLPEGELAFFVDGKLECEIHVVGAIAGSACTVDLKRLGAHEVEVIFSNTSSSETASRTDYIEKYPTATSLQVSVEPVAPEYLDIGPNAYGYEQYAFEVGRLLISGRTSPGFVPYFDCTGQGVGCVEPEVSLNRNGTASVPLYAQHRLNSVTGNEEWHVGFPAYSPALRESNWFWQFPEESVGTEFFHAVGEPSPSLYEPSNITLPLDLNGGHYPFYHWFRQGEGGGSIAAVEGVPVHALTLGTYDKFDGAETTLKFASRFFGKTAETEGCVYRLVVDGQDRNEKRNSSGQGFEFDNGYQLPAGPHSFELWVERKAGAGPGNCQISSGSFEAYEKIH